MDTSIVIKEDITLSTLEKGGGGYIQYVSNSVTSKDIYSYGSNKERIEKGYLTKQELKENQDRAESDDYSSIVVKAGVRVSLPAEYLQRNLLYKFSQNIVNASSYPAFIARELEQLLLNEGYKHEFVADGRQINHFFIYPAVFLWSKVLKSWVNLSAFVSDIDLGFTKEGGNFNLELLPVEGAFQNDEWDVSYENQKVYIVSKDNRDKMLFSQIISENDPIFLRCSKMPLDSEPPQSGLKVSGQAVAGSSYDMIGLVDGVSQSYNAEGNTISISVSGRDMMKLLVEDGVYFFVGQVGDNVFVNEPSGIVSTRTNIGIVNDLNFSLSFKSIEEVIKFIVAKYSTSGMIPYETDDVNRGADVFSAWKDRRSKRIEVNDASGQTEVKELPMAGVWSIGKFAFDESIRERLLVDTSLTRETGSVINAIKKACKEPFVEFFGDTYGDTYVWTARKPPFDRSGYLGTVKGNVKTNTGNQQALELSLKPTLEFNSQQVSTSPTKRTLSDYVIDVTEGDVLSESLAFSNEVYSWYRVTIDYQVDQTVALTTSPAVSFNEYAQIWGAKAYSESTGYVNHYSSVTDEQDYLNQSNLQKQILNDLKYVVESNCYLSFTRQGSITLNLDRTIKRGNFIFYVPTREVFYVDQVVHSVNVNRQTVQGKTVLTVSRGMKYDYLERYFELIEFGSPAQGTDVSDARDYIRNWKVNRENFDFLLERKQFG